VVWISHQTTLASGSWIDILYLMQVEYAVILASDGTSWIFYQEILPVVIDKRRRVRLWWQFLRGNLSIQLNRHNSVNFLAAYAGVILIDSPFEVSIIQQERSVLLTSEALELHRYDKLYSFIVKKRCHDRLWAIGHVLHSRNGLPGWIAPEAIGVDIEGTASLLANRTVGR